MTAYQKFPKSWSDLAHPESKKPPPKEVLWAECWQPTPAGKPPRHWENVVYLLNCLDASDLTALVSAAPAHTRTPTPSPAATLESHLARDEKIVPLISPADKEAIEKGQRKSRYKGLKRASKNEYVREGRLPWWGFPDAGAPGFLPPILRAVLKETSGWSRQRWDGTLRRSGPNYYGDNHEDGDRTLLEITFEVCRHLISLHSPEVMKSYPHPHAWGMFINDNFMEEFPATKISPAWVNALLQEVSEDDLMRGCGMETREVEDPLNDNNHLRGFHIWDDKKFEKFIYNLKASEPGIFPAIADLPGMKEDLLTVGSSMVSSLFFDRRAWQCQPPEITQMAWLAVHKEYNKLQEAVHTQPEEILLMWWMETNTWKRFRTPTGMLTHKEKRDWIIREKLKLLEALPKETGPWTQRKLFRCFSQCAKLPEPVRTLAHWQRKLPASTIGSKDAKLSLTFAKREAHCQDDKDDALSDEHAMLMLEALWRTFPRPQECEDPDNDATFWDISWISLACENQRIQNEKSEQTGGICAWLAGQIRRGYRPNPDAWKLLGPNKLPDGNDAKAWQMVRSHLEKVLLETVQYSGADVVKDGKAQIGKKQRAESDVANPGKNKPNLARRF